MHFLFCLRRLLSFQPRLGFTPWLAAGFIALALGGCATPASSPTAGIPVRLDETPRIAVMSAFEPELTLLLKQPANPVRHRINGIDFTTGTLQGKPVVLFLSGISMVNASMNTQLALDRFNVTHIVFSGIAGGVNPALNIGDVACPRSGANTLKC
jgi:adenosylhomocysteine nucleosidase